MSAYKIICSSCVEKALSAEPAGHVSPLDRFYLALLTQHPDDLEDDLLDHPRSFAWEQPNSV